MSLQTKLLMWFLVFSFISIQVIWLSVYYIRKKESISFVNGQVQYSYSLFLKNANAIESFFSSDITNDNFFISKKTNNTKNHAKYSKLLLKEIDEISKLQAVKNYNITNDLVQIKNNLHTYNTIFYKIMNIYHIKGYKDYGITGKMRDFVHKLQEIKEINQEDVLSLRRREKDYLIRNEDIYITMHKNIYKNLMYKIENQNINKKIKDSALIILYKYSHLFNELTFLNQKIESPEGAGLKRNLNKLKLNLEKQFYAIIIKSNNKKNELYEKLRIIYITSSSLIVILSIALCIILSKIITKPITLFSDYINTFVSNYFIQIPDFVIKNKINRHKELVILTKNFNILKNEIVEYINQFKEKVDKRTHEIQNINKVIEAQNKELKAQRDELSIVNNIIDVQNKKLDLHNKQILSSIRYAKRIQSSLLPSQEDFLKYFREAFVLYKPKDIVSGDFYFLQKHNDYIITAAVDCTGHGVPGAFLSLLVFNGLNQAIVELKYTCPVQILKYLNNYVYNILNKKNKNDTIYDGMDIAICCYHSTKQELYFSGAFNPLLLIRNKQLLEIKGEKIVMGTGDNLFNKQINQLHSHKIELQKNDIIYLITDGYYDQFGIESGKKFKKKQLKHLLLSIQNKTLNEQKSILDTRFEAWKGSLEQTDDVLILGFKFF